MKWTIGRKLYASFIALLLVLFGFGTFMYQWNAWLLDNKEQERELIELAEELRVMQVVHYQLVDDLQESVRTGGEFKGQLDWTLCSFGEWYYSYDNPFPELNELFNGLEGPHEELHKAGDLLIKAIEEGNMDKAEEISLSVRHETLPELMALYDPFVEGIEEVYESYRAETNKIVQQGRIVFFVILSLAVFIVIVLVLVLTRNIAGPLNNITKSAEKIATGDLDIELPSQTRTDEIGVLSQAFSNMINSLQNLANAADQVSKGDLTVSRKPHSDKDILGNAFLNMTNNLRDMIGEITEGVDTLVASNSEILVATAQVVAGTSETASAVSQSTTTSEEVKQTAQVSSQKAKYVVESAEKSKQVFLQGKNSVEKSIEKMYDVRKQMELIADSVVKLSEQNQAIGEIILTVNDLAEQSNILAINASIEAAKAGDHGKGFAVVAQEVKNLAQQSKQSTNQVRGIINDIQKATSAAVMVTEQGSKSVEAGIKQAVDTGESMDVLSNSISEAAQAAMQIAASSHQQLVGMEQIVQAMENIKQTSSQNVASIKQVEDITQDLNEFGQKMKDIISKYKS